MNISENDYEILTKCIARQYTEVIEKFHDLNPCEVEPDSSLSLRKEELQIMIDILGGVKKDNEGGKMRNLSNKDFNLLILFAFRYALGRRSTAPSIVCDLIRKNLSRLTAMTRITIVSEIVYGYENHLLGDNCDVAEWLSLKRELENEYQGIYKKSQTTGR